MDMGRHPRGQIMNVELKLSTDQDAHIIKNLWPLYQHIAATCLEHGVPILAANERHFSRVPGLEVIAPSRIE
jgi:hypothetical protein